MKGPKQSRLTYMRIPMNEMTIRDLKKKNTTLPLLGAACEQVRELAKSLIFTAGFFTWRRVFPSITQHGPQEQLLKNISSRAKTFRGRWRRSK